jgi:hypothetical protein
VWKNSDVLQLGLRTFPQRNVQWVIGKTTSPWKKQRTRVFPKYE